VPLPPPALFDRYPALSGRLAHRPFVTGPTPVRPLEVEGVPRDRLWCKDDSRSCPVYGGNKPRKLEWLIGRALERGARRLVTTGGLGTHHGLATTILGRASGLATSLVLVDQPWTEHVEDTLRAQAAYGAEQIAAGGVAGAALHLVHALGRSAFRGERPSWVPTGGSSPRGQLGFASAGLEIARQIRDGDLPRPSAIYLPVGSGGTAAGLLLGLALAEMTIPIVGVLVSNILPPSERRLRGAARACARLIRRHADAPVPDGSTGPLSMVRDQLGPGYGAPTPQAREALEAAAAAGVELDTTYTAKCLASIRDRAARDALEDGPILFWNTLNAVDVWSEAPVARERVRLPAAVEARLQRSGDA
jgi:D-cysteine desulfhydrase